MDTDDKVEIGKVFHRSLQKRDWPAMRVLLTEDVKWTLPGDNQISGTVLGVNEVTARAEKIASFGLHFELLHVLVSRDNFALSLHNTATRDGRTLDEFLATVCRLRDGKIAEIETYLSDVTGMNAFFA